jgi:thymidylate synthase
MKQYQNLINTILTNGIHKDDRTGVGTTSIFGHQMRFNLQDGFPIVTTKFTSFRLIMIELLWLLKGDTNIKYLLDRNCHIWDEWADKDGNLGPVYGKQWRNFGGVDQIKELIDNLKTNPNSRRHIVSAWNPPEISDMKLPPCHSLFQFYVADNKLSCQLYQRSSDVVLGVPFNIASYSALTHIIAHLTGYEAGDFVWTGGDCHLYDNSLEAANIILQRNPYPLPTFILPENITEDDILTGKIEYDQFKLDGYQYHPKISVDVAV